MTAPADMQIAIGRVDRESGTVEVRFEQGGRVHIRRVNAVIGPDGRHDRAATVARVDQVAAGVAHKFALGVIGETGPIGTAGE